MMDSKPTTITAFNVGDEVVTTRTITVIGKGDLASVGEGKVGKVTFVDSSAVVVDVYGIGKAIVQPDSLRPLKQPDAAQPTATEEDYATKWMTAAKQLAELRVEHEALEKCFENMTPPDEVETLRAELAAAKEVNARFYTALKRIQTAVDDCDMSAVGTILAEVDDDLVQS